MAQFDFLPAAKERALAGKPDWLVELQWPGVVLDEFQRDIIRSYFNPDMREIFIKGCTKAGKGCAVSIATNLWFYLHERSKVIVTGPSFNHARDNIFAEICSWRRSMKYPGKGWIRADSIVHHGQHQLMLLNPDSDESFSGHHGPATLTIFDEASRSRESLYMMAGTYSKLIVALSNPRVLSHWFRKAFPSADPDTTQTIERPNGLRRCITISANDCRNVIEGKEIIPNQITRERLAMMKEDMSPQEFRVFGLAQFPEADEELQLFRQHWFERCEDYWRSLQPNGPEVQAFGLDVAASEHGDKTVLAAGGVEGVHTLHVRQHADTMQTVAWVLKTVQEKHGVDLTRHRCWIAVDMDGVGKGVGDRLKELRCHVVEFHGGKPARNNAQYANKRAEAYGELSRRIDPHGPWPNDPWALPSDPALRRELLAHCKVLTSDFMRFRLTPKNRIASPNFDGQTLKEALGHSPDRSDAVAMLYDAIQFSATQRTPRITRPLITGGSVPSIRPSGLLGSRQSSYEFDEDDD